MTAGRFALRVGGAGSGRSRGRRERGSAFALPATALLPGLVLAASAACVTPTQVRESSAETLREADAAALSVEVERGSVAVVGHAGSEIEIEAERNAHGWSREAARSALAALIVAVRRDDRTGRVRVTSRSANAGLFRPGESHSVRLSIRAPAGIPVEVRTADGRIELTGLTGPVTATSGDGRITASRLGPTVDGNGNGLGGRPGEAAPIQLRTADGRITGEDLRGAVVAETADGRITLGGRLTEVTAVTADGDLRVDAADAGAAPTGIWRLATEDGDLRLELPETANATLSVLAAGLRGRDRDDLDWERRGVTRVARVGNPGSVEAEGALILIHADDEARIFLGPRP